MNRYQRINTAATFATALIYLGFSSVSLLVAWMFVRPALIGLPVYMMPTAFLLIIGAATGFRGVWLLYIALRTRPELGERK